MSDSTISALSGTRFTTDYFERETAAATSGVKADGILATSALVLAVLSAICLLLMCLLANPWLAAASFVATYSLFWIVLAGSAVI